MERCAKTRWCWVGAGLLLAGCGGKQVPTVAEDSGGSVVEDAADTGILETAPVEAFRFAVLADPHVTGPGAHLERLQAAVDHLHALHAEQPLELVVVLGDIAWGDGWEPALGALSALPVPWVPVQGDNPIQVGEEVRFSEVFGGQLSHLATVMPGFEQGEVAVADPVYGTVWLTNAAFSVGEVTFVVADWNSRDQDTIFGETPDLFDVPGGTLPFVEAAVAGAAGTLDGRVVMLSHMPFLAGPGFFDLDEQAILEDRLGRHQDALGLALAGHLHVHAEGDWPELGVDVVVTDATWDDTLSARVVTVSTTNQRVLYSWTEEVVSVD